jgi:hypothetical protein
VAESLLDRLGASRQAFLDALEAVDADLVTVPGVMEDWSVRDIVVHVAAWCEHATDALELAAAGRGDEFAYSTGETDAMNVRILEEARRTSARAALEREDAAFSAFRARVGGLDPALLPLRLGNGDTVEEVIAYDGPDHYAEHTEHLRAWFTPEDHDGAEDVLDDA